MTPQTQTPAVPDTAQRGHGTVGPVVGHGPWAVIVKRGCDYVGEYRHATRERAEAHAADGRDKLGVLGFRYSVECPCPKCGKHTEPYREGPREWMQCQSCWWTFTPAPNIK